MELPELLKEISDQSGNLLQMIEILKEEIEELKARVGNLEQEIYD